MTDLARSLVITAVGGDMGQALVKAARLFARPVTIIGTDAEADGIGPAFADTFAILPLADDPGYIEALDELCSARGASAVVPAAEAEIRVLSRLRGLTLPSGTPVVCQSADVIDVAGDKLACMRALEGIVPLAAFADGAHRSAVDDLVAVAGFPLVVKARVGSGSRSLRVATDDRTLAAALSSADRGLIVQQYIDGDSEEYSVGVFRAGTLSAGIVLRRTLGPVGCSWDAVVVEDEEVLAYALAVAERLGVVGGVNVQVRRSSDGVRLLEVNPRFSSLVAARAAAGFNDLEWSVELVLGGEQTVAIGPYAPIRFRRFFHEVIVTEDGPAAVAEWSPRTRNVAELRRERGE